MLSYLLGLAQGLLYNSKIFRRLLSNLKLKVDESTVTVDQSSILHEWNKGVFGSALEELHLFPRDLTVHPGDSMILPPTEGKPPIHSGTFHGSKLAATEIYKRIENRYGLLVTLQRVI